MSVPTPPILFLIFNRPEPTVRVFAEIRNARPTQLFIGGDGPRADRPDDAEKVRRTREIVAQVDWPCEVHTLFQETNLGCQKGPPTAISWFFEHVEAGIILEDDCVPDPSFFPFCAELLERYADDTRILQISGDSFQAGNRAYTSTDSYYFSVFPYLWGWASWRRAWQKYDLEMPGWGLDRERGTLRKTLTDPAVYEYWENLLNTYYNGLRNSWDRPWAYICMASSGLCINPSVNLIANIGFGADATHTKNPEHALANMPLGTLTFPLTHPKKIAPDRAADAFAFKMFGVDAAWQDRIRGSFRRTFPRIYYGLKRLFKNT